MPPKDVRPRKAAFYLTHGYFQDDAPNDRPVLIIGAQPAPDVPNEVLDAAVDHLRGIEGNIPEGMPVPLPVAANALDAGIAAKLLLFAQLANGVNPYVPQQPVADQTHPFAL